MSEEKIYSQAELNEAVTKAVCDMTKVLERKDADIKRLEEQMSDLISRDELLKRIDEEREYLKSRGQFGAEHILVHNFRDLVDNAPTVDIETVSYARGFQAGEESGLWHSRPQGECENCDYLKFTEKFTAGFVEGLNKYGITSVEQLSEILKAGADMRQEASE